MLLINYFVMMYVADADIFLRDLNIYKSKRVLLSFFRKNPVPFSALDLTIIIQCLGQASRPLKQTSASTAPE